MKRRGLPRARRAVVPLTAFSIAAAGLVGCSTGGGNAAGSDCGNELKLGILTAFSGELGDFGKTSKEGFDYAIAQIKDSGELPDGWTVETVVGDEKTSPEEGLRAASAMVKSDKVSAIMGPSSGPIVAMVDLAKRYETPIISQFAGTVNLDDVGGDWIYRTVASDASDGKAVAQWLGDDEAENVVAIVQNEESTVSPAKTMEKYYTAGGGNLVKTIKYNAGQASYNSITEQALNEDPGYIFLAGGQESGVTILKELAAGGFPLDKVVVTADMAVPEVIEAVGADKAEGMNAETPFPDTERPEYVDFAKGFKEASGHDPGLFVDTAYDAATIVGLAATAAENTCGSAIGPKMDEVANAPGEVVTTYAEGAKLLAEGKDINFEGASGPVDFDETGTVAGSYAILEATGGTWKPVTFYGAETFTE